MSLRIDELSQALGRTGSCSQEPSPPSERPWGAQVLGVTVAVSRAVFTEPSVLGTAVLTAHAYTLSILTTLSGLSALYRGENGSTEVGSLFQSHTQLMNGGASLLTQACRVQSSCF